MQTPQSPKQRDKHETKRPTAKSAAPRKGGKGGFDFDRGQTLKMPNDAHVRIDEGVKRGPRLKRKTQARKVDGTFLPIVSPGQKAAILQDALESLQRGETTDQVGLRHGFPGRSIRAWLIGSEEAEQARRYLIASQLARIVDEIKDAKEPLPLACAREEFRAWSWIAERRESRLYGNKQEVTVTNIVHIDSALEGRASDLLDRLDVRQVIDVTPSVVLNTPCDAQEAVLPSVINNNIVSD